MDAIPNQAPTNDQPRQQEPVLTPLAAALRPENSPAMAAHGGVRTVAEFAGTPQELGALLDHAGVYDRGDLAFLRCSGRDRVRWLNGMVTNSVKTLEDNQSCYAFVLNAQGRIQGDVTISRLGSDPDALILTTGAAQVEALTDWWRRYIIMDQVAIEPMAQWTALGVAGPQAAGHLAALALPVPPQPDTLLETTWNGAPLVVAAVTGPLVPQFELWVTVDQVAALWRALTGAMQPCGAAAVDQLRILSGIPEYGVDITGRDLPQETNQMRALHFTKGCYLGQEIVERIRSRGGVHRTLTGFCLQGSLTPPAPVASGGKPVGEITSITGVQRSGGLQQWVALGYIRKEALEAGAELAVAGQTVRAVPLPFSPGPEPCGARN
jgi:folate-binding protein YgfZ